MPASGTDPNRSHSCNNNQRRCTECSVSYCTLCGHYFCGGSGGASGS